MFYNDITDNRSAIIAYSAPLKGNPVHNHRDFDLDPYDLLSSVSIVGNHMENNKTGLYIDHVSALFLKKNKFFKI